MSNVTLTALKAFFHICRDDKQTQFDVLNWCTCPLILGWKAYESAWNRSDKTEIIRAGYSLSFLHWGKDCVQSLFPFRKTQRRIHKCWFLPAAPSRGPLSGPVALCALHHSRLSSPSAFGSSFTCECTTTPPSTVPGAWRGTSVETDHTAFLLFHFLQVTWQGSVFYSGTRGRTTAGEVCLSYGHTCAIIITSLRGDRSTSKLTVYSQ